MMEYVTPYSKVLEPSAGIGKIVSRLLFDKKCTVTAVELNKALCNALNRFKHEDLTVINENFLTHTITPTYDYVVAVPPYKFGIDAQHIMRMYEFLIPNGKLISYTLPHWVTGITKEQIQFREWLAGKNAKIDFVEDNSYVGCPKMLLVIQK